MVEAGKYIINNFYNGNPKAALAKNKTKDEPPSLKALIDKIKQEPKATDESVPSIGWFYNAVNLAAHEEICEQKGLQTFGKLGHSHKLQLLHIPRLKAVKADEFEKSIETSFKEKDRLARHAHENNLSVREFKIYLNEQCPSDEGIDLTNLPSIAELRKQDPKELVRLWNAAMKQVEIGQKRLKIYEKALKRLKPILDEIGETPETKGGRHEDWTLSKNNVNICTGCENDCLYCYSKSMAQKWKQVKRGQWSNMRIRQADIDKPRKLHDGLVGFPTSHDITPANLNGYIEVLGKLLRVGNEVLIITKPHLDCIKAICNASLFFKDKILFRFTIGAMDNSILGF
jgi:hypothetical protein